MPGTRVAPIHQKAGGAAISTQAAPISQRPAGSARTPDVIPAAAPVTDLLLVLYRRWPVHADGIEVTGDAGLVDFWLERVGFG